MGFQPVGFDNWRILAESPPRLLFLCSLSLISFSFIIVVKAASAAEALPKHSTSDLYNLQFQNEQNYFFLITCARPNHYISSQTEVKNN